MTWDLNGDFLHPQLAPKHLFAKHVLYTIRDLVTGGKYLEQVRRVKVEGSF
jgi:hypothetical protein